MLISDDLQEELVDENSIMGNLFYLSSENPAKVKYENKVATVLHKAMRYTCVDSSGPTKQVNIELVDLLEKVNRLGNPKKRSLIYMKIAP
jgi:hypothetical protein